MYLKLPDVALRLCEGVLHVSGPLSPPTRLAVAELAEQRHHSLQPLLDTLDTPLLLATPLLCTRDKNKHFSIYIAPLHLVTLVLEGVCKVWWAHLFSVTCSGRTESECC